MTRSFRYILMYELAWFGDHYRQWSDGKIGSVPKKRMSQYSTSYFHPSASTVPQRQPRCGQPCHAMPLN
ncbi:hypothetical protein OUZ56_005796 [Daphnia magna]|uniref:Uncharacterized protein n=1 Tax=Daphnia magna TaxID=35525 RepID=A0ABQ9YUF6_9CRUS|nr:hypothetical protein OUZ56_005796 [Daphnia magna]